MGDVRGEVFIPFRAPVQKLGTASRVRTTLLVSSVRSLRKRGLFDRYLDLLPRQHHETVLAMIAGQWVAMPLALAHYRACESLGIPREEVNAIGREVGDRIEGTYLATMIRMAGSVGATPWTALSFVDRLYERIFAGGGGVSVHKQGPKDAEVQFVGVPLCGVPYFRVAMEGVFEVGMDLFCTKSYAKEAPDRVTPTSVVLRIAWA